MNAVEIQPKNRIAQYLREPRKCGNRVYTGREVEAPPGLPAPFEQIFRSISAALPFRSVGPASAERHLIRAYSASVERIRALCPEWNTLLQKVVLAGIQVRTDKANADRRDAIRQERWFALLPDVPAVGVEPPDVINMTTMEQTSAGIHATLHRSLTDFCRATCERFAASLDEMVRRGQIGVVEWSEVKPTVARYTFRRNIVDQCQVAQQKDESYIRGTTTRRIWRRNGWGYDWWTCWRDSTKIVLHTETRRYQRCKLSNEFHTHEIIDARRHALRAPVAAPRFVREFIRSVPSAFAPHMGIVTGDIVKETVVQLATETREWVERKVEDVLAGYEVVTGEQYSPTVNLGHWSLVGWSDRDF